MTLTDSLLLPDVWTEYKQNDCTCGWYGDVSFHSPNASLNVSYDFTKILRVGKAQDRWLKKLLYTFLKSWDGCLNKKAGFVFRWKGLRLNRLIMYWMSRSSQAWERTHGGCWVKGRLVYFNNNGDWIWCSHPHKNFKTWKLWVLWWLNSDSGLDLNSFGTDLSWKLVEMKLATFCFPWWFEIPNSILHKFTYLQCEAFKRLYSQNIQFFQHSIHSILYSSKFYCK